ncbi:MAG: hypothetical protein AAB451_03570 [Patescibacteria group bacterium]
MSKYKYYFRKPRSEIVGDILKTTLISGVVAIAATSPYFIVNALKAYKHLQKYPKNKISDIFSRLKRQGLIETEQRGGQIHIKLSPEGRKKAGIYQINSLLIKRPKKWDSKWRIVIFDIAELKKTHREAFRGKLKELGFQVLQKSVWVHPFNCEDEVCLLRDFFGLDKKDVQLIIAEKIEDSEELKKIFDL